MMQCYLFERWSGMRIVNDLKSLIKCSETRRKSIHYFLRFVAIVKIRGCISLHWVQVNDKMIEWLGLSSRIWLITRSMNLRGRRRRMFSHKKEVMAPHLSSLWTTSHSKNAIEGYKWGGLFIKVKREIFEKFSWKQKIRYAKSWVKDRPLIGQLPTFRVILLRLYLKPHAHVLEP